VNIAGSISSHQEQTRTSDNSAKYHVEVLAEDAGMPEGLARVLDILQSSIEPILLGDADKKEIFDATGKPVKGTITDAPDANGKPREGASTKTLDGVETNEAAS
jgi:hypothetical protein